tara:strand:+ start:128 stop:649 length:522 start_codon:yes stop_codon:yes gene_type:complete
MSYDEKRWDRFVEACGAPDPMAVQDQGPVDSDQEGKMARSQLMRTAEDATQLVQMIQDPDQLPSWVQSKLTKAADYIYAVRSYLQYQKTPMTESMGGDIVEDYFAGDEEYFHEFLAAVEKIGFEAAAEDYNLGMDATWEVKQILDAREGDLENQPNASIQTQEMPHMKVASPK